MLEFFRGERDTDRDRQIKGGRVHGGRASGTEERRKEAEEKYSAIV